MSWFGMQDERYCKKMASISRRQFLTMLARSALCALAGEFLSSCKPQGIGPSASATPELQPITPSGTPLPPFTREALYYTRSSLQTGRLPVRCDLCPRRCSIRDGERGDCGVRENRGGTLYTLVYGRACAAHADPIEKKPFYHFLPGSRAFSLATAGCNLHCLYCQNWEISQQQPESVSSIDLPPEAVVAAARQSSSPVIAYTYTEPTVFYEYMLDSATLARAEGLRNVVISAGYINEEPLRRLCQSVDAIKIDFKGFSESFYQRICSATLQPVLQTMKTIAREGVHLEIVTLVVPTLNDDPDSLRGLCRWIVGELGQDIPVHFSRFYPLYKLTHLPMTPVDTLEQAHTIAREEGIHYVYIGNVPGHPANNTYCHHCGQTIIARLGYTIAQNRVLGGRCEFCGQPIPGVWG